MADRIATDLGWDDWLRASDREVLSHLLDDSKWREQAEALSKELAPRSFTPRAVGASPAPAAFPSSCTRSLPFLRRQLRLAREERGRYRKLLDEVLSHPSAGDGNPLTGDTRARLLPLAEHLLAASRRDRFEDAHLAESLARLAARVCDDLDPAVHTRRLVLDMKGRCWTYLGNSLRLQEKYDAAEAALARADGYLEGTLELSLLAEYRYNLAALRTGQRRFAEAAELLRRAVDLCREVGDDATLARLLTSIGSHALDEGSPRKAKAPLREALELVDRGTDPRTTLFIYHNLTLCLAELDELAEARRLRDECQPYYRRFDDPVVRNRRNWLDGILAAGRGDTALAGELLRGVLQAYVEEQHHLHAACVGLDLAAVYARQGAQGELHELAEKLAAVCLAGNFQREAQAALHIFIKAVKDEAVSVALAHRVEIFLRRSARHPEMRFSPAGVPARGEAG